MMEKVFVLLLLVMVAISFGRILQEPKDDNLSGEEDNFRYKEEEDEEEAKKLHRADGVSENTDNDKDLFEINLEQERKHGVFKVKGMPGSHMDQGDIVFDECEEEAIFATSGNLKNPKCKEVLEIARKKLKSMKRAEKKDVITRPNSKWSLEVPYDYDLNTMGIRANEFEAALRQAIGEISEKSCLTFQRKTDTDQYYLSFHSSDRCNTQVGRRNPGPHVIRLAPGCYRMKPIAHEMMHALGFWHEQSRHDRDNFITVNYKNIIANMAHNFDIALNQNDLGYAYDFRSIMHYPRTAFGIVDYDNRGRPLRERETMTPIDPSIGELGSGPNDGLSITDALQLNERYCNEKKSDINAIELERLTERWMAIFQGFSHDQFCSKLILHLNTIYDNYVFMAMSSDELSSVKHNRQFGHCIRVSKHGRNVAVCYTRRAQSGAPLRPFDKQETADAIRELLNGEVCTISNILQKASDAIQKVGENAGFYILLFGYNFHAVWNNDANGIIVNFECRDPTREGSIMALFK